MAYTTTIRITHPETASQLDEVSQVGDAKTFGNRLSKWIDKIQSGGIPGNVSVDIQLGGTAGVAATGTLTLSSSSGTVGGTIGGTSVTVSYATSDSNTAGLLATAINANSTVSKWVTAAAAAGVVTLTARSKGYIGNNITLVASGTGCTASGAKLTGGTGDDVAVVTYSFA